MIFRTKLWLQVIAAFIGRYIQLFRHAWSIRDQLEGERFDRHEAEFLASAMALEKTPVSPLPRIAMWTLIAFCLIALLWSIFGKVDIVATASGKIIASGNSKTIQALETSSIKRISVREGDTVKKGDLLIELDATDATANAARFESELAASRLQTMRAQAVLIALENNRQPILPRTADIAQGRLQEAQQQAIGMYQEYRARLERINADIARRQAELQSSDEIVRKLEHTLPHVQSRAQDYKDLSERNFVSRHAWMEKDQLRMEQEADLATQRSRAREIRSALRETQGQRVSLTAELRRQMLDAIADGEQKSATFRQEIIKAASRQNYMRLVAPIDGTVQQLAVNTIGGVVTPAQILMLLVPTNHPIEIDAMLENKDIGFVSQNQHAEVKIETFPYTRYGTIKGKVAHISHDAVSDEKHGLTYLARVQLAQSSMLVDEKSIPLSPGMVVSVEIKTGRRRVIDYFLSPLMQHGSESLRER
jgi:hemolysin D